jgi:hypothetical protein
MADQIDQERAHQALEEAKAKVTAPGLDPMVLAEMEAAIRFAQVRLRVSRRTKSAPPHAEGR